MMEQQEAQRKKAIQDFNADLGEICIYCGHTFVSVDAHIDSPEGTPCRMTERHTMSGVDKPVPVHHAGQPLTHIYRD